MRSGNDDTKRTAARLLRALALIAASTVVASACAADDPIDAFDESRCELQAVDDHDDEADDHGDEVADDHDDEAEDHDDEADDHDDDQVLGVDYVVEIDMLEFGYSCDLPTLELGTVLEVRMTNVGAVEHEAVFGDLAAQNEAAAEMAAASSAEEDDGHAGDHGTPTLVLAAGESGSIVVAMDEPGDMVIGCHVPGHWDAGMRSDYVVSA